MFKDLKENSASICHLLLIRFHSNLAGVLDDVQAAFGMHVMPHIQTGVMATRTGTIMAGALSFKVRPGVVLAVCGLGNRVNFSISSSQLSEMASAMSSLWFVLYHRPRCLPPLAADHHPGKGWSCGPPTPQHRPGGGGGGSYNGTSGNIHRFLG